MPYLRQLSSFRDSVRHLAMEKNESAFKDILALCDKLRDVDLIPLGVALDDQEGKCRGSLSLILVIHGYLADGKALVKLVPPAELMKARDEKRAQAEAKATKKAAAVEAERLKRQQKLEKGRVPPEEMFKPPNVAEGTYSSWSDEGIPLTDGDGKELSKNAAKKVQKDLMTQKKLHEDYLVWKREQPE